MIHDIIFRDALVFDGSGRPAFVSDVAVSDGRIAGLGSLTKDSARSEVDASGLALAPGFIDSHSHADLALTVDPAENEKLHMGVTTEIIGQCGFTPFPLSQEYGRLRRSSMAGFLPGGRPAWDWADIEDYQAAVMRIGLTHNIVPLVGHGSVRLAVMGDKPVPPTAIELDRMRTLVDRALAGGAAGLSSGLIYAPGCFADTAELKALCEIAAERGGLYVTHIRGETAPLIRASIEEALDISRHAGLPMQISHLKVIGLRPEDQGAVRTVLQRIETAREQNLDVHFDCYPYTEGSTLLSALIPMWAHEKGTQGLLEILGTGEGRKKIRAFIETDEAGWENWIKACGFEAIKIGALPGETDSPLVGLDLARIAADRGEHPYEALFDILIKTRGSAIMVFSMMRDRDMRTALVHSLGMVGTDAIPCPPGQGRPHPRGYGTFPRILGRLARDEKLFTIPEAVRKMTSLPAAKWGLADRGLIGEGMKADLVVFDPKTVIDRADYAQPRRTPKGMVHVLVNGRLALESGRPTGIRAGKFIRRQRSGF